MRISNWIVASGDDIVKIEVKKRKKAGEYLDPNEFGSTRPGELVIL